MIRGVALAALCAAVFMGGAAFAEEQAPAREAQPAAAQPPVAQPQAAVANTAAADIFEKQIYVYRSANSRDPFLSIITFAKIEEQSQATQKMPTIGYDLSQMRVIAILQDKSTKRNYALLGLPDGKFYTVRTGMALGLHDGFITRIDLEKIVVSEKIRNYKGQLITQDTELMLHQGEDR